MKQGSRFLSGLTTNEFLEEADRNSKTYKRTEHSENCAEVIRHNTRYGSGTRGDCGSDGSIHRLASFITTCIKRYERPTA